MAARRMWWRGPLVALLAVHLFLVAVPTARAAPSQPGFTDGVVVGGFERPTAVATSSDGRIFVAEQPGRVRVVKNGVLLAQPFVSLTVDSQGERGVIGIALAPGFPSDPRVFVHYTATTPTVHNRVSVFTANGDVAVPGSETVILDLPSLTSATNHNGGGLQFATNGMLLVGVGENANPSNAQLLTNPFGKVLRINANGSVPANPFSDGGGPNDDRIFALGFRNPFSLGVQPGSGVTYVNDVGSSGTSDREEINPLVAGGNYGWPLVEGVSTNPAFVNPVFTYDRTDGCAIVGGVFYNPAATMFPAGYVGRYFFGDLCGGWLRAFDPGTGGVIEVANAVGSPTAMGLASDGSIVYTDISGGTLRRLAFAQKPLSWLLRNSLAPGVAQVAFTYGQVGDDALACDWDGNGTDTPGVHRPGTFYLRNSNSSGVADTVVGYGDASDVAVCGDWDGNGTDTVGIYRGGVFYLRNSNTTGTANVVAGYGDPGDVPVVGDWDGNGTDTIGVWRPGAFYLRNSNSTGTAEVVTGYGIGTDDPITGDWDGNGTDTVGVVRP